MRLVFLCSCLELGRDGVGDYVRRLATALAEQEIHCTAIALNDRQQDGCAEQPWSGPGGRALRLGANVPWPERRQRARAWIEEHRPDWISLQFVSYGFDVSGRPIGWGQRLAEVIGPRHLHLMMHELWVGEERDAPLRRRLLGAVQRAIIVRLVRRLAPRVVHTHARLYQKVLARHAIAAELLPLFGNIPVADRAIGERAELWARLSVGTRFAGTAPRDWQLLGIFGSVNAGWSLAPVLTFLRDTGWRDARPHGVVLIGRPGEVGREIWERTRVAHAADACFAQLGELSPRFASAALQLVDVGLATTPWALIEKSGAVAAFLDHGVPVVVSRRDGSFRGSPVEPAVDRSRVVPIAAARPATFTVPGKRAPADRVARVAAKFLADLGC